MERACSLACSSSAPGPFSRILSLSAWRVPAASVLRSRSKAPGFRVVPYAESLTGFGSSRRGIRGSSQVAAMPRFGYRGMTLHERATARELLVRSRRAHVRALRLLELAERERDALLKSLLREHHSWLVDRTRRADRLLRLSGRAHSAGVGLAARASDIILGSGLPTRTVLDRVWGQIMSFLGER